jgi:hypothetical protein
MFGTQMVGAIHGRLLTAWSAAGIFGPVIVNYLREYQLEHGVPRAQVYDITAYILCGLLALGFICNWLVKPVADSHFMTEEELATERRLAHDAAVRSADAVDGVPTLPEKTSLSTVVGAWLVVGIPLAWGIWLTLGKAWVLFH